MGVEIFSVPRLQGEIRNGITLPQLSQLNFPVQPDLERAAGVMLPIFGMLNYNNLGIGTYGGLEKAIQYFSSLGFKRAQILPANELSDPSPYNPISSIALEPAYRDCTPDDTPGLTKENYERIVHRGFLEAGIIEPGKVNYKFARPIKYRLDLEGFKDFYRTDIREKSSRAADFKEFCEKEMDDWLNEYLIFRVAMHVQNQNPNWRKWPEDLSTIEKAEKNLGLSPDVEFFRKFYAYRQWATFTSAKNTKVFAEECGMRLIGDVPFGVSVNSADVFAKRNHFIMNLSTGAKREEAFQGNEYIRLHGQNWGPRPYYWPVHIETEFQWWGLRDEKVFDYVHEIRDDHVRGKFEAWGVPWEPEDNNRILAMSENEILAHTGGRVAGFYPDPGSTNEDHVFNATLGKMILSKILEISLAKGGKILVEDAGGDFPQYIRDALKDLNLPGMTFIGLERQSGKEDFIRPESLPVQKVAQFGNHDHWPLRKKLEHLIHNRHSHDAERDLRGLMSIADFDTSSLPSRFDPEIQISLLEKLGQSPAAYRIFNPTDLVLEDRLWNTHGEGSWRIMFSKFFEDYEKDPLVRSAMMRVSDAIA